MVVELLVGAALAVAAGIGLRLYRYPGGRHVAFSGTHRADRQDLDAARRAARSLRREARRELADAQNRVERADRAYRRRIDELELRLQRLHDATGRGRLITGLGPVSLHEHALVFLGNDVALAGLGVRFERGRTDNYLYVTLPGGYAEYAKYPVAERPEDDVRRFAVEIQKAIAAENRLREERAAAIRRTEAELAAARTSTDAKEAARRHLASVTARQKGDRRVADALDRLEAARDRWEDLTGRRPPG